jgi:hypothetical protein
LNRVKRLRQLRGSISGQLALLLDLRELIADLALDIPNGRACGWAVVVRFLVGAVNSIGDVAQQGRDQAGVDAPAFRKPVQLRTALRGERGV